MKMTAIAALVSLGLAVNASAALAQADSASNPGSPPAAGKNAKNGNQRTSGDTATDKRSDSTTCTNAATANSRGCKQKDARGTGGSGKRGGSGDSGTTGASGTSGTSGMPGGPGLGGPPG